MSQNSAKRMHEGIYAVKIVFMKVQRRERGTHLFKKSQFFPSAADQLEIFIKLSPLISYSSILPSFCGGSDSKESSCSVEDLGSIPGLGRFPGGGHGNPLQYSYLETSHGQRSLAGYSPWGHTESDVTE